MTVIYIIVAIAPILAGIVAWIREDPPTEEELARASMRSMSWPSKPGQDPFTKETGRATR